MSSYRRRLLQISENTMSGIMMTSMSNYEVMRICYQKGWAANPSYMTFEEAAAVTDTSAFNSAFNNSDILYFNEAKYFTGITGTISFTAPRLREFAFLPNVSGYDIGGKFPVCYRYDIGVCTKLSLRNGVETILNPYIAEIVVSPNNTIWAVTNGHLGQGQILYNKNNGSILWTTPDYKGGIIIYPLKYQQTNRGSVSYSYARFRGHTIVANNFYSGNASFSKGGYYVQKIISFKNTSYYNSSSFPSNIGSRVPKSIVKEFIVSADDPKDFMADTNYTTNFLNPDVCNFQLKRVNFGITIYNEKALFPLKGLYADEYFMTKEECASVTSLGGRFRGSIIEGFNEFQYFTGLTRTEEYEFINSNLTSIILPSTITEIGDYSFAGCTNLTSITIPEGVTKIGDNTFEGCTKLTSIILPSTITEIGANAFKNCSLLTTITIPENVTYIGDYAFSGCSQLGYIEFQSINAPTLGLGVFGDNDSNYVGSALSNSKYINYPENGIGYDTNDVTSVLINTLGFITLVYHSFVDALVSTSLAQYIDTKYYPNNNSEIEVIAEKRAAENVFFGVKNGSTACFVTTSQNLYYHFGNGNFTQKSNPSPLTGFNSYKLNKDGMYFNDTFIDSNTNTAGSPFNLSYPLYIFGRNNAGTLEKANIMAIKELIIRENGVEVMHLYACLYKDTPCMYDYITNTYFYDKKGNKFAYMLNNEIIDPN